MSRILITGATGLVGHAIVEELLLRGRGYRLRALVRSAERARDCLGDEVELVEGDLTDRASVRKAVEGCSIVYHAAGLPEQWQADEAIFQRVNVEGTRHMVAAALDAEVENFVYTSTIDVLAFRSGVEFDESKISVDPMATAYERSKQAADRVVTEALESGLPARFLHPSGVYGPAAYVGPGVNDLLRRLARREIPLLLPGGMPVVLASDVARGHVLAAQRAPVGARFILSESFLSLEDVARAVCSAHYGKRVPPILPTWVARIVSEVGEAASKLTRRSPLIPRGQLQFLGLGMKPSARHAMQELGWQPTTFADGVRLTLDWLRQTGQI